MGPCLGSTAIGHKREYIRNYSQIYDTWQF